MNPAIPMLTLAGLLVAGVWFSKPRVTLSKTGDFFVLAWLYYGFSVAADLLLGWDVPSPTGATDFLDEKSQATAVQALILYLSCGAAFVLAYICTPRAQSLSQVEHFPVMSIPAWLLIGLNLWGLSLFSEEYMQMSREERGLLLHGSIWSKLPMVALTSIQAANVLYIVVQQQLRKCLAVALFAVLLGLASGDRSDILLIAVCFVLKWRIELPRPVFAGLAIASLATLAVFKTLYTRTLDYFLYGVSGGDVYLDSFLSFSAIDGYSSFLILTMFLEQPCPYWLGASYVSTTMWMALPSNWRPDDVTTLAWDFTWTYFPEKASRGGGTGFSALAEAFLNFGLFGPALLGVVWGFLSKRFDTKQRGIAFYVFAMMTCRLFRSDFASLLKNWVVLFGGSMALVYLVLTVLASRRSSRISLSSPARPLNHSP